MWKQVLLRSGNMWVCVLLPPNHSIFKPRRVGFMSILSSTILFFPLLLSHNLFLKRRMGTTQRNFVTDKQKKVLPQCDVHNYFFCIQERSNVKKSQVNFFRLPSSLKTRYWSGIYKSSEFWHDTPYFYLVKIVANLVMHLILVRLVWILMIHCGIVELVSKGKFI